MTHADPQPGAAAPQVGRGTRKKKHEQLHKIAWYQRAINLTLLAATGTLALAASGAAPQNVVSIVTAMVSIAGLVATVLLADALHGKLWAVLCGLLILVPYINLLVLLVLSVQATRRARKAGLKVGLLGVSSKHIQALRPDAGAAGSRVWMWVFLAIAVVPLVGLSIYRSFPVRSASMLPTLHVRDHIFAEPVSSPPRRGEVIVFRFPENRDQLFIKRAIALPGDTFEVINGRPIINDWLVPHCYVGVYSYEDRRAELYVEYLGDSAYGTIFDGPPDEVVCKSNEDCGPGLSCRTGLCGLHQGPYKITTGAVWVMGDNRHNSHDSRSWFHGRGGGVPFADIIASGRVVWMNGDVGGSERLLALVQNPPVLPAIAASLQPALDKCLRERPPVDKTTPPPG